MTGRTGFRQDLPYDAAAQDGKEWMRWQMDRAAQQRAAIAAWRLLTV